MPIVEFKMPKMGESISEATIINWTKKVGDFVEAEETLVEVATDKVDSEIPSPFSGTITEIRFGKDAIVAVGEVLALIETDGRAAGKKITIGKTEEASEKIEPRAKTENAQPTTDNSQPITKNRQLSSDNFLSPLIISIAQKENLSIEELQTIPGSGTDGRIQKSDVFNYLKNRKYPIQSKPTTNNQQPTTTN